MFVFRPGSVVPAAAVTAVLLSTGIAPYAVADDDPLPTVFVTATRIATPIEEVLAPVIVIDRETIERSTAADAADLLRFHAGLDVARNGGPGQPTSLFIRGAESNHTLVLVDGVRVNPGTIGLPPLQNISPDMIDRIEVVKGPRSALWGSDAIGGVVNVVTRRGSRDGWVAEAGYGDYDTRRASLNGGFGWGSNAALDFGVAWLDSDGFPTRSDDHVDRGFEDVNGNVQLRVAAGPGEVALGHWRAEGNSEYSDYSLVPVDQDYLTSTTSAQYTFPVASRGTAKLAYAHMEDKIEQNQAPDYLRTDRDTFDAQFEWRASDVHTLSVGAMVYTEDAESESYGTTFRAETDSSSVYLQDQLTRGPHLALLAVGYTDHETAGSAVTWNAEYGYTFAATRTRLFALAGLGFRAPDATDRYGYGGNPDLQPEESRNHEVGLRQALGAGHTLGLSAFQTSIDDLIEFVITDFTTFEGENRNVGEARIRGLEASWRYGGSTWQAHAEAIHQDPRNRTDDTQLLRRAEDSLTVGVTRAFGPVQLGLDLLATGPRKDFGFPEPVTLDGYVLANLTAQWQATRTVTLLARIENLLDEDYELADNYNTAGRGLYLTVRYAPGARSGTLARTEPTPHDE